MNKLSVNLTAIHMKPSFVLLSLVFKMQRVFSVAFFGFFNMAYYYYFYGINAKFCLEKSNLCAAN